MPRGFTYDDLVITLGNINNRVIEIEGRPTPYFESSWRLAVVAPEDADQVIIESQSDTVQCRSSVTHDCADYFNDAKTAIAPLQGNSHQVKLMIAIVKCDNIRQEKQHQT